MKTFHNYLIKRRSRGRLIVRKTTGTSFILLFFVRKNTVDNGCVW